jgi:uncharacterized membrane protein
MFPRLKQPPAGCNFLSVAVLHSSSAPLTSSLRFGSIAGDPSDHGAVQWLLRRNCSITPAQLGWLYLSLCLISLGIATLFWLQGARGVMPFAWLELVGVGSAFLFYARHARDGEKILLQGSHLVVELETAGQTRRAQFNREWVRVEPKSGDGSLIEVSGQGQSVRVGRHVRPELRPELAREIRQALRTR